MRVILGKTKASPTEAMRYLLDLPPTETRYSFGFSFYSRWHPNAWKGPYALRPVSQQVSPRLSSKQCQCLAELRSFPTSEGGMSAASFLHSSRLQAISAVMLLPVHVQKVPQASEHLCPVKLQTRCDICCACQSICTFIPTDSGVSRVVDPQKPSQSKTMYGCVAVGAAHSTLHLCSRLNESVKVILCRGFPTRMVYLKHDIE